MKILALALFTFGCAFGQAVYIEPPPALTVSGNPSSGSFPAVLAASGAHITICSYPSCASLTQTYTDATAVTPCPTNAQVVIAGTSTCTNAADSRGNFGFWVLTGGQYQYKVTLRNGTVYGPYPVTMQTNNAANVQLVGYDALPYTVQNLTDPALGAGLLMYKLPGANTVPVTAAAKFRELPSLSDWGMKGDGSTDNTPLFNAMLTDLCVAGKRPFVYAATGYYLFNSRPNSIGCGLRIIGQGISSSPTDGSGGGVGTIFVRNYSEADSTKGFLTWDGALGTDTVGSGLDGVYLNSPAGRTGGIGILLTGTNSGHRAGFFRASNAFVGGTGGGNWFRAMVIDGSCCTTPGNSGIRDVVLEGSYFATSTDDFKTVYIYNGTNIGITGGLIYASAGGSANVGLYITGDLSPQTIAVSVAGLKIGGDITVDYGATGSIQANVYNVHFTANASTYTFLGPVTGTPTNDCTTCTMLTSTQTGARIVTPAAHPLAIDNITVGGQESGGDDRARFDVPNGATAGLLIANPTIDGAHVACRVVKMSNNLDAMIQCNDGTTFWAQMFAQWSTKNLFMNYAAGSGNTAIHANAAPDPLTVGGFIRVDADPTLGVTDYGFGYGNILRHRIGAAAPVAGTYKRGDIIWNTAPAAAGTIGWVCVSAGTPGTWKTFGTITP